MIIPEPVQRLINAFSSLPGIGPKTASRLTFYLLREDPVQAQEIAIALRELNEKTGFCKQCFHITTKGRDLCEICEHPRRSGEVICVVEEPLDVIAFERTGGYQGHYHVLHGVITPIEGITEDDIKVAELVERVSRGGVTEVILATNPSMFGDATAMTIQNKLKHMPVKITRLALGLPVGSDLEYADQYTLERALAGRQEMPGS